MVKKLTFLVIILFLCSSLVMAKAPAHRVADQSLQKTAGFQRIVMDGNAFWAWVNNKGAWADDGCIWGVGSHWPGENGNSVIYQAGLWIAGKVGENVRTACAEYEQEFQPGMIINGVADNPNDNKYRIYVITKADLNSPSQDYLEWPVEQGAPVDENGNPLIMGDKTAFWVMNDLNPSVHNVFSTPPMGIEVRVLLWQYNRPDEFNNMIFHKLQFFNKSENTFEDTYIAVFSDPDIGDSNDDAVGCDTTLSLGYCFNGASSDPEFGDPPPAAGYDFFQGPVVPGEATDTAFAFGQYWPGQKNLGMTAFNKFIRGNAEYGDPETGDEVYNLLTGKKTTGDPIIDPITGEQSRYVNAGDPITGEGWLDSTWDDRRLLEISGPFTLAPGDSQEVVCGCIVALGSDNLSSITALKQADLKAQIVYDI